MRQHPTLWTAHVIRDDPYVSCRGGYTVAEFPTEDYDDGGDTLPEAGMKARIYAIDGVDPKPIHGAIYLY